MEKRVCRMHLLASNVTPRRPWVYAVGTVGLDVNLGVFLGVLILLICSLKLFMSEGVLIMEFINST
jgi:hypothetical protein